MYSPFWNEFIYYWLFYISIKVIHDVVLLACGSFWGDSPRIGNFVTCFVKFVYSNCLICLIILILEKHIPDFTLLRIVKNWSIQPRSTLFFAWWFQQRPQIQILIISANNSSNSNMAMIERPSQKPNAPPRSDSRLHIYKGKTNIWYSIHSTDRWDHGNMEMNIVSEEA